MAAGDLKLTLDSRIMKTCGKNMTISELLAESWEIFYKAFVRLHEFQKYSIFLTLLSFLDFCESFAIIAVCIFKG